MNFIKRESLRDRARTRRGGEADSGCKREERRIDKNSSNQTARPKGCQTCEKFYVISEIKSSLLSDNIIERFEDYLIFREIGKLFWTVS